MGQEYDLRDRTMRFALSVGRLCGQFPVSYEGHHVRGQLFRAGTGMAANYRAACRARSKPDFIAKLGTAIEEGDEADFWMDFAAQAGLLRGGVESPLRKEADELIRILIQSQLTARRNMSKTAVRIGTVLLTVLVVEYAFLTIAH
jgi:four helix bundle protein